MKKLKIIKFINKEYDGPKGVIIFMTCTKGILFTLLVFVVNQSAEISVANEVPEIRLFFLYLAIGAAALICTNYTITRSSIIAVTTVRKVRVRLIDKLRQTELQFLENTDKGKIYARINQDTDLIMHGMPQATGVLDAVFSCIFLFIYIAFVSLAGFVLLVSLIIILYGIFFFNYFKIREKLDAAKQKEASFFDLLNDTLSGFKEIKINTRKNNALFADIRAISRETEQLKTEGGVKSNQNVALAFAVYVGLLGVVAFLVPLFTWADTQIVVTLVSLVLFLFGPLNAISNGIPVIMRLNMSVENLEKLESGIDAFRAPDTFASLDIPGKFKKIVLSSVGFRYTDEEGETLFTLAPADLTIRQGEVLFIVGGNGSGKSTLLKLLTGLYYPLADGRIILNDQTVTRENYQAYRELFSIIFTDFHMFKKLYGVKSVDEKEVKHLLREMDIHTKTEYTDGRFTNTDLSTGQRKRLAYISVLLENKPIYVFDEWAADQDPTFRRHFYERFLEDMRAMNKTVIAVTHDDRYFNRADRVIKMEEGKIK